MANLIIKPTSGGSLVLQDEGGDAALTVGTTGVSTIANASITTGTIAAGTIAAGVTFPTGHVVKVSHTHYPGAQVTLSSNAAWQEISSNLRLAHQAASATNILLMQFSIPFNSPSSNQIYHAKFYNYSGTADITLATATGLRNAVHWSKRVTSGDTNDMNMVNMIMRHVAGSTSAITYSPYFWTAGPDIDFFTTDLNNAEGHNAGGTFIITEIQA